MKKTINSIEFRVFIAAICLLFLCPSCLSRIAFGNGDDWIPKEFDPQHSVFLIQYFGKDRNEDQRAKDFMKKNYPYSYDFVPNYDPPEGFADKSKYRFVLVPTGQMIQGPQAAQYVGAVDFYFYDRQTGKKYPPLQKGSYKGMVTFKPIIETIVRHSKG
jgi:hypothetical protein